jgi:hypothetical protein
MTPAVGSAVMPVIHQRPKGNRSFVGKATNAGLNNVRRTEHFVARKKGVTVEDKGTQHAWPEFSARKLELRRRKGQIDDKPASNAAGAR